MKTNLGRPAENASGLSACRTNSALRMERSPVNARCVLALRPSASVSAFAAGVFTGPREFPPIPSRQVRH